MLYKEIYLRVVWTLEPVIQTYARNKKMKGRRYARENFTESRNGEGTKNLWGI